MNKTKSYCFLFGHPSKDQRSDEKSRSNLERWMMFVSLSPVTPRRRQRAQKILLKVVALDLLDYLKSPFHTTPSVVLSGCLWKSLTRSCYGIGKKNPNRLGSCGFHMQMRWLHGWSDTGTRSQGPSYTCLQKHSEVCLSHRWYMTEHLLSVLFE